MKSLAGVVLGVGLGGLIDGIALHQIAQWHNMGSAVVPPTTMEAMKTNMRWDGYFHAATWLITAWGVYLFWRDSFYRKSIPPLSVFVGQLILGWGIFNFVEGLIDHHMLGIHHVRDLPVHVPFYDWLFIAIGGQGFILVGSLMAWREPAQTRA